MANTKISIVQYLNAVPLAWGILEGEERSVFESTLNTPAECADLLANRTVDIGLIPSIEYQRIQGARIVPGPVVASTHRVRSVILVSEMPLWKVRTVAYDKGSRTSVTLAQVIFKEFYGTRPHFRPSEPDIANMLAQSDAALLIGDQALKFVEANERPDAEKQRALLRLGAEPLQVFDLAERWRFLTGLPFIFAFWAVRDGFADKSVNEWLNRSRDFGVANITAIVEKYSGILEIKKELLREYFERNVYYHMDRSGIEGLQLFYEKAARIGAIKSAKHLEFL